MEKLDDRNISEPMDQKSNAAMAQVGWLGETGTVYPLGTALSEIHKTETASYRPLYIQVGTWEQTADGRWFVEED